MPPPPVLLVRSRYRNSNEPCLWLASSVFEPACTAHAGSTRSSRVAVPERSPARAPAPASANTNIPHARAFKVLPGIVEGFTFLIGTRSFSFDRNSQPRHGTGVPVRLLPVSGRRPPKYEGRCQYFPGSTRIRTLPAQSGRGCRAARRHAALPMARVNEGPNVAWDVARGGICLPTRPALLSGTAFRLCAQIGVISDVQTWHVSGGYQMERQPGYTHSQSRSQR